MRTSARNKLVTTLASALALPLAACGSDPAAPADGDPDAAPPPPAVTYYADIKPILDAKCGGCHQDGGVGPFSLTTYDQAFQYRDLIAVATSSGVMPPWPPSSECNEYHGDRSLSGEQLGAIDAWLTAGAPAGDPAAEGAPLAPTEVGLSRIDLSFAMPTEYTPSTSPDDYRCFVIDWPAAEETFVTGFRVNPGQRTIVHHAVAYLSQPENAAGYADLDAAEAGPGYTCFGGPGGIPGGSLGAWVPGSRGTDYPAGTGIRVRPGSKVILQVHYNTLNQDAAPDLTSVDVSLAPTVAREAAFVPFLDPTWLFGIGMDIPAGDDDVVHSFTADPTYVVQTLFPGTPLAVSQPLRIYSANLHMHELGTHITLALDRAGGERECLLDVADWNFHWQGDYWLNEPVLAMPGDRMYLECHWDNSAANQPDDVGGQPRVPHDVTWGFGTQDEMCIGGFYVTAP